MDFVFAYSFINHIPLITQNQADMGIQLYALVDAGQQADFTQKTRSLIKPANCRRLFENTFAKKAIELSPVLIEINTSTEEKTALCRKLDEICQTLPILSYLHSHLSLDELTLHLRSLMRIETDEADYLLRYADTQMLAAANSVLTPAQRTAFFDGIAAWWIVDHCSQLDNLAIPPLDAKPAIRKFYFDDEQIAALLDAAIIPALICQMRHFDADFMQHLRPAEQTDFISRNFAQARQDGLTDNSAILVRCLEQWQKRTSQTRPHLDAPA